MKNKKKTVNIIIWLHTKIKSTTQIHKLEDLLMQQL